MLITTIADGTYTTTYVYDGLDQLTRENNQAADRTWVYAYDNGGNILSKTEYAYTTGTLGEYNPLRYRGYFYDTETGLYFLNSRYYNPETGRFINADSVIDRSKILGANIFSYCFYGAVDVYGHIQNRTSDDCDKGIYFVAKDMVPHHKWN